MANTHIMIDLETLDTRPTATILTIGAVKFDPYGNENITQKCKKLYIKIDVDSCDELECTISQSTIDWWATQSTEAQEAAFDPTDRIHIITALEQLYKFCWGAKYVWSNGAGFDVVICENLFHKISKACPWKYWQVRDCRTMFDLGLDPELPKKTAHNALEDALAQAIGVQTVVRKLAQNGVYPFDK